MLALLLLSLVSAEPSKPKVRTEAPVTSADCSALAERGFDLYLANLKNDEGIQYEMREMSKDEQREYLAEVKRLLLVDKPRYLAEAHTQCVERVRRGEGTRKQYDCAMAAKAFPEMEKCLGIKLGGQAL